MMSRTIVLAGALAQKPYHGGHAWVLLNYLLGFQRLGWEVLFLDCIAPGLCTDSDGAPCTAQRSVNLRATRTVMERFGLGNAFALLDDSRQSLAGCSREEVLKRVGRSALLINIMGFLTDAEILERAPQRVFLDIDPGFGQMWQALGLSNICHGHDAYVTIGANIGQPECQIPTCNLEWITTRPPIVLDHWRTSEAQPARLSSIGSWRGAYGPLEYNGRTYGLRVHEFRKFAQLPRLCPIPCEIALDIHPAETRDLTLLQANGWLCVNPRSVGGDPWSYRTYIQSAWAEFMVAKNIYVQSYSGWFSDRSVCYLASGKPVLVQDTGLARSYEIGAGLLTFTTLEEALAAVDALICDYAYHARAAREIAATYFDSDIVLRRLLNSLGVA
jgi:hypothetical protein